MVQLEAMACGRPVVNTDLPSGVPWVARHEKEGLTVPPEDADAMAEAISRLLDDPVLAARLGEAGFQRANTAFNIINTSEQIYRIYSELVAKTVAHSKDATATRN